MAWTIIGEGETPEALSARTHRPLCMLLRANRLYSTAWLMPGREIALPPADFCAWDAGLCPLRAARIPAEPFCSGRPMAGQTPERLWQWWQTHDRRALPQWLAAAPGAVLTVRPCESVAQLAARGGGTERDVRRWNRYYGRACPGVQLFVPGRAGQMDEDEFGE